MASHTLDNSKTTAAFAERHTSGRVYAYTEASQVHQSTPHSQDILLFCNIHMT